MLWLDRKQGASIVIGENIVVTVVEIREEKVRLGVEAPPELPARRLEVPRPVHVVPDGKGRRDG